MKIEVIRKYMSKKSTIGELYIDGKFECYTLEDVVRPEGVKIYGETAIPFGPYNVEITMSNRFKKPLPLIYNTTKKEVVLGEVKFSGVRIHSGNTDKDTHGCILVGNKKGTDVIYESRNAFKALMNKIDGKEDIILTIIDGTI